MIEGNGDTAILFGTGFMVSLYLFIAKTVQYIKEDYPEQINIKLQQNTKEKYKWALQLFLPVTMDGLE